MINCPPNCGLCCKHVDEVPEISHLALPDGTCRHLTTDNQCGIYDDRPDICHTDWVRAHVFPDMPMAQFDEITKGICRTRGAKI